MLKIEVSMSQKICIFEGVPSGFVLEIMSYDSEHKSERKTLMYGLSKDEAQDRLIVLNSMKDADLPLKQASDLIPDIILELEKTNTLSKLSVETQYIMNIGNSSDRLIWFLTMFEFNSSCFVLPVLSISMSEIKEALPRIEIDTF